MDVLYAIDGSQTVDIESFNAMKNFVERAVSLHELSPEMSNVGLLVFGGDRPLVPLLLSQGTSKITVLKVIKEAGRVGGRRKMDKALNAIANEFKIQSVRDGVGKLAVLLSTGDDDSLEEPELKDVIRDMKTEGIKVVIINMGKPQLNGTLEEISRGLNGDLKNVKSPNDLLNALGVVEKAATYASRKFISMWTLGTLMCELCFWYKKMQNYKSAG